MKKLLIFVSVCLMTAFCAWATLAKDAESTSSSSGNWVKVDDDCGKCIMNDTTRKCGKDGGFMESVGRAKIVKGSDGKEYIQYTYRCKTCGHGITYRNR